MAKSIVGLQSFIWENNLKSAILLIAFPLILCTIVIMIIFSFNLLGWGVNSSKEYSYDNNQNLIENYLQPEETTSDNPILTSFYESLLISPLFFCGVGLWFLIAWAYHRQMITAFTHSRPLTRAENPLVYNIVENLCISRGLVVPSIYIIDEPSLNAFASGLGEKDAMICFTKGLADSLSDSELEAVAAHELTHIMNRDTRLMLVVIIFAGIITTITQIFVRIKFRSNGKKGGEAALIIFLMQILAFILGFFITAVMQAMISRNREFLADSGSVELVKTGQPLISALKKIAADSHVEAIDNRNVAQMFIDNPLQENEGGFMSRLFATHPPISERIRVLEEIG